MGDLKSDIRENTGKGAQRDVAIYARVASAEQQDRQLIKQVDLLRAVAKELGVEEAPIRVFAEQGSGCRINAGFVEMLNDCAKGRVGYILVTKPDRLFRALRAEERNRIMETLKEGNIGLITPEGRIDLELLEAIHSMSTEPTAKHRSAQMKRRMCKD